MPLEDLEDEIRMEIDVDGLKEELAEQFPDDPDEAMSRMEALVLIWTTWICNNRRGKEIHGQEI